jgi:hypothetical protein
MKWWADWLADNPRDHARCPGLTTSVLRLVLKGAGQGEARYLLSRRHALFPQLNDRITKASYKTVELSKG